MVKTTNTRPSRLNDVDRGRLSETGPDCETTRPFGDICSFVYGREVKSAEYYERLRKFRILFLVGSINICSGR